MAASSSDAPVGVVVCNIGSPEAPTPGAVRRYLEEFLSDPAVVDLPRPLWWLLRRFVILPLRSPRSARAYRQVWTPEGSPLIVLSGRFRDALARRLGERYRVVLGMRYGRPSLADAFDELAAAGCRRAVLFPAFPQYSRTTTGTAVARARELAPQRGLELSVVRSYPEDPGYVGAVSRPLRRALDEGLGTHVVLSFHGLPQRYVEAGDPYAEEVEATARAVAAAAGLGPDEWTLTYQSRFGREPWLEPSTQERVPALARRHPELLVACPGFTVDCLETLEEIGIRLVADFEAAGGRRCTLMPCLNDDPVWVAAAAEFVRAAAGDAPG